MDHEELVRLLGELHGLKIVLRSVISRAGALCVEPNQALAEIKDSADDTIEQSRPAEIPAAFHVLFRNAAARVVRQTTDLLHSNGTDLPLQAVAQPHIALS